MTICIAALAEKGASCVAAADREITVGMPLNIAFEHHERKIEQVGKCSVVLSAGNALVAAESVTSAKRAIAGAGAGSESEDVSRNATILRDVFIQIHLERAEQVILRPRGGTLDEFKTVGAQRLPLPVYQQIDNLFFNFTLNTEISH